MFYKVAVTEVFRLVITVEAGSEEEAHRRASDAWSNTELCLDEDDFEGVEFHVIGETDCADGVSVDRKGVVL